MAEKYTVFGAGHGGKAMAAHLALMGAEVALWNRTFEHISIIKKRGGIELESTEGGPHGFGKIDLVTADICEAVEFAQVIMVVVPSSAHADVAKATAPYLKDGQIVILHPGRTLGALEFAKVIRDQGCTGGCDRCRGGNFHLCQPCRRSGPGAHLPHQGGCASCCAAGLSK